MPGDEDYAAGRRPDRVYFSKEFPDPFAPRAKRFLYRVLPSGEREEFAEIDGELVIRVTAAGLQQIKALFYTDTGGIEKLTLQRFSGNTPKADVFTFRGDEIKKLLQVASLTRDTVFEDGDKLRIDEENLQDYTLSSAAVRAYAKANGEIILQLVEHEITERDIVALAYRKAQLEVFRKLLDEPEFFAAEKGCTGKARDEDVWQLFFERNPWIFGYGLFYVFSSSLDEAKLEQVVAGYSVAGAGKRADALMRTRGLVSALCFVEIKTHQTRLLETQSYRREAWAPSRELSGAIAQVQRTVLSAEKAIGRKLEAMDDAGAPTGEIYFLLRPRSVVVVGSLAEFKNEHGVHESKFTSFEMFRRSMGMPEIVTFDELYERARFIAETRAAGES